MDATTTTDFTPPFERLWKIVRFEPTTNLQKAIRYAVDIVFTVGVVFTDFLDAAVLLFVDRPQLAERCNKHGRRKERRCGKECFFSGVPCGSADCPAAVVAIRVTIEKIDVGSFRRTLLNCADSCQ